MLICFSVTGSFAPAVTAFAPPAPQLHVQRRTFQQTQTHLDYRHTHLSSTRGAVATRGVQKPRVMSKIKSPNNRYSQFQKEGVLVGIEATSPNSRRISGEIDMNIPIDDIFSILTDYDNLSTHVPNLVESKVINNGGRIVGGRPRVYQRGAQKIFGFEFGADVTMDMSECVHHSDDQDAAGRPKVYSVDFTCVDSQFFSQFDGSWILEEYASGKTMVRYIVDVRPKGVVPVAALEWRIKEDVPLNVVAVSNAASARWAQRRAEKQFSLNKQAVATPQTPLQPVVRPQPVAQRSSGPLQRLTDQAAYNLKRTAKSVLPSPVLSTAKQAMRILSNSNSAGATPRAAPTMSIKSDIKGARGNRNRTPIRRRTKNRHDTDWYPDETMQMYLKDS
ncbi:hypothetical protein ACHAXT_003065 [Thalassiosira profunda]